MQSEPGCVRLRPLSLLCLPDPRLPCIRRLRSKPLEWWPRRVSENGEDDDYPKAPPDGGGNKDRPAGPFDAEPGPCHCSQWDAQHEQGIATNGVEEPQVEQFVNGAKPATSWTPQPG